MQASPQELGFEMQKIISQKNVFLGFFTPGYLIVFYMFGARPAPFHPRRLPRISFLDFDQVVDAT